MIARALRIVGKDEPQTSPQPQGDIHAYESEHRARIARKDWAAIHIRGDHPSRAISLPANWKARR